MTNPVPSSPFEAPGLSAHERLACMPLNMNMHTNFPRNFSSTSNVEDQETQAQAKPNPPNDEVGTTTGQDADADARALARSKAKGMARSKSVSINNDIISLGREKKWKDILRLYHREAQYFDNVNTATLMTQLGRIQEVRTDDPMLKTFLADLHTKLIRHGITWLKGTREIANVVHAIAKMNRRQDGSPSGIQILRLIEHGQNARLMFVYGNEREIAMCVWAFASLGIQAPNFFRLLDERAEWMIRGGTPQNIANCAWACGALGIQSPNLFRWLDDHAERVFRHVNPLDVSGSIWACGALGIPSPNLFRLLDTHAEQLFETGSPDVIANCVWACGRLGVESPNLFRWLDARADW